MARKTNWYFEGWKKQRETDASGKKKTVWKYTGVYYQFSLSKKQLIMMKAGYTCLSVLLIGLWVLFSFLPGAGRENAFYAGAPWFLQIIPFMYLIMGLFGIWRSGEKLTFRNVRAGYYRVRIVKWILLILQSLCLAGELVFMIIYHSYMDMGAELVWLTGIILCLASIIGIFILNSRIRPYQIPE